MVIDPEIRQTYIVAEMACSHGGSFERAWKIVEGAAQSGADAVQFQMWTLSKVVAACHPAWKDLERLQLSPSDWQRLIELTQSRYPRLDLFACVYDAEDAAFAESLGIGKFKVHATEVSNVALLDAVAGKAVHLCTGAATFSEIDSAVHRLSNQCVLLHGIQLCPTPPREIRLKRLQKLRERYGLQVGFQDHSLPGEPASFWTSAMAVALGATVLEKHITWNRTEPAPDQVSALEPSDFREYVQNVRQMDASLGSDEEELTVAERSYRENGRRRLVAAKHIPKGTPLMQGDFRAMKTGMPGLSMEHGESILGKCIRRALAPDDPLQESDIE